ncbi:MAG TPA: hypothetical protein VJB99_01185 [Patescibacteria group bacterium]|nr:hypothetical protein [Patescibacteria group bacterium]
MHYGSVVDEGRPSLEACGMIKLADDLAAILDNPLFTNERKYERTYEVSEFFEARQKVFNAFCAVCLRAGLPLPQVEAAYYRLFLPKSLEGDRATTAQDRLSQLKGLLESGESDRDTDTMWRFFTLFPSLLVEEWNDGIERIERRTLLAVLNLHLLEKGLLPLRPNYEKCLPNIDGLPVPSRPVSVVVIDDSLTELVNTVFRLAGWPNINISTLHYSSEGYAERLGDSKEAHIKALQEQMMSPDVVLLDKDLSNRYDPVHLTGPELVPNLRSWFPNVTLFGNTGGTMEDFEKVGVHSNCEKGRRTQSLANVLRGL